MMNEQPDPVAIERVYQEALRHSRIDESPLDTSLRMLHARRDHLDILIAMLEAERSI